MSLSMQETNQTSISSASEETSYLVPSVIPDKTYGGSPQPVFMPQPFENSILDSVKSLWQTMPPGSVREQIGDLIDQLGIALSDDHPSQSGSSFVPRLNTFQIEDDSSLIEWIAPDIRLGFSIESDPSQSSWYIATSEKLGYFSAAGLLFEGESPNLVDDLVSFIRQYS